MTNKWLALPFIALILVSFVGQMLAGHCPVP
jgi:hypothetical protein